MKYLWERTGEIESNRVTIKVIDKDRIEKEQEEQERIEREKLEKEKAEQEKIEQEKKIAEQKKNEKQQKTNTPNNNTASTTSSINKNNTYGKQVFRTPTGKRYHFDPDCGGKNSYQTTLEAAKSAGLTPCKKCAQQ